MLLTFHMFELFFLIFTIYLILYYWLRYDIKSPGRLLISTGIAELCLVIIYFSSLPEITQSLFIFIAPVPVFMFCSGHSKGKVLIYSTICTLLAGCIYSLIYNTIVSFEKIFDLNLNNITSGTISWIINLCMWILITSYLNKKYFTFTYRLQTHFFIFIVLVSTINSCVYALFLSCINTAGFAGFTNICLIKWGLFFFGAALTGEIIYILLLYHQKTHYAVVNDFTREYLDIEKAHFQKLQERDRDIRKFRHDMQGHLTLINNYLTEQNYDKLSAYLHSLSDAYAVTKTAYQTGSTITDSILNQKHPQFTENDIAVHIYNDLSELNIIGDFELCIIFSNAIQNAVEACIQIEDRTRRQITIRLQSNGDILALEIVNSVNRPVKIMNNHIATGKSDKQNHGFGLMQIERIVSNLDGKMYLECTDTEFHLVIRLKKGDI